MDPKLSNLDPKLREAYERVMNGAPAPTPTPSATAPVQQPSPTPVPEPQAHPTQAQQPPFQPTQPFSQAPQQSQPQPPLQPAAPANPAPLDPTPAVNSTVAYNAHNSEVSKGTGAVKSGKRKALLIVPGILIFLVVYTFIWVYILHLKLPFLP